MKSFKGWTAHTAVRIICFIAVLASLTAALCMVYDMFVIYLETRVDPEVVLSNIAPYENYPHYYHARLSYIQSISGIAKCLAVMLAALTVLLLGAGRRRGAAGIHFAAIDRPYWDIGLAAAVLWTMFMAYLAVMFVDWYYRINTLPWDSGQVYAFIAIAVTAIAVPVLLWLLGFAKRIKAGHFWRHTLVRFIIWVIPCRLRRGVMELGRSLWAGTSLTGKVALISSITFLVLVITGIAGTSGEPVIIFIFAAFFSGTAAFLLLRFARRIYKLEKAVREISSGGYDVPVYAGGGELGSIADSVNNISAGINTAVEERMKSERLRTELITNVSHDIRTPLTSIITYTDLLKNEGLNCDKAPEYLDILVQKSQRLKALTDDLFEAAKAASGNIETDIVHLDIVSLINQVLGELDSSVKASGLDLRVSMPEHLSVRADGKLMWRVMDNLLSNALRYSLPGSRVYLDAMPAGSEARIDIKNISAAELNFDPAELTERFKRGDESRTDGGSGLGLSIVQSFIAAQGGRLTIAIDGDLFKASVYIPLVK